ncbi:histidine kinase [Nocardia ninae]|uniref:histidine kinase n=1 Tax=Nocardia ninae NBRC 108245 TaxID=1210091 RepID=A0A511MK54_9NOCA|nr:histidine kinase [Nocardia ninae]GEM40969.1 hypothetical protein NN4_54880 [Nocardia ninae NBRC 108245]
MRYSALLAVTAVGGALNGLATEGLPGWRQLLFVALFAAAYIQGRRLPERHGGPVLLVALAAAALIAVVDVAEAVGAVMSLALFVALPWVIGRFRRQQAELLAVGQERIRHLEQTQVLAEESARLRERARIATDMHDALGHELALIAVQAGALELSADLNESNRQAASLLRASAVTASDELRRTVSMLRADHTVAVEPPSMSVEALIARARTVGMTVDLVQSELRDHLPPLVESALRRVVQETLTNAARHAPGAGVRIEIEQHGDEFGLVVTNPITAQAVGIGTEATGGRNSRDVKSGGAGRSVGTGDGRGSGLLGLAERVQLLGGTLQVDDDGSVFTVTARMPVRAGAE